MSNHKSRSFILGALLGSVTGAFVGLLYAPEKGEKTRKRLEQEKEKLREKAKNLQAKVEKEGGVGKMLNSALQEASEAIGNLPQAQNQNKSKAPKTVSPKKKVRYFRGTKS